MLSMKLFNRCLKITFFMFKGVTDCGEGCAERETCCRLFLLESCTISAQTKAKVSQRLPAPPTVFLMLMNIHLH